METEFLHGTFQFAAPPHRAQAMADARSRDTVGMRRARLGQRVVIRSPFDAFCPGTRSAPGPATDSTCTVIPLASISARRAAPRSASSLRLMVCAQGKSGPGESRGAAIASDRCRRRCEGRCSVLPGRRCACGCFSHQLGGIFACCGRGGYGRLHRAPADGQRRLTGRPGRLPVERRHGRRPHVITAALCVRVSSWSKEFGSCDTRLVTLSRGGKHPWQGWRGMGVSWHAPAGGDRDREPRRPEH